MPKVNVLLVLIFVMDAKVSISALGAAKDIIKKKMELANHA